MNNKHKAKNWPESFGHALRGILNTAKTERNFRLQIFFAVVAVAACVIFAVPVWHFVMVALAIILVLVTELINTAIEALTDLITNGQVHPLAKKAKDAAAAAVLVASGFAVIVAVAVGLNIILN